MPNQPGSRLRSNRSFDTDAQRRAYDFLDRHLKE